MMLSPDLLLAFIETANRSSFAAAARELGSSSSTIAKAVGRLESALGLRLFHRTTRHVTLTADGEMFLLRCGRVVDDLRELETYVTGERSAPVGTLRLDLPVVFGRVLVLPILARLTIRYPGLLLDVRFSDGFVDLVKEGVDVAVRIGVLPDSSLIARQIATQDWILCASPEYLKRQGAPKTLEALEEHDAIVFRMPTSGRDQIWHLHQGGHAKTFQPRGKFRFTDGEAIVQFAELGLGIAQLPDYMVNASLSKGYLVELMPEFRAQRTPIYAVMPASRMIPARVRVLLDALSTLDVGPRI